MTSTGIWIMCAVIGMALIVVIWLDTQVCVDVRRRRRDRRRWDDLVGRHQKLDRDLDKIWHCW